MKARPTTWLVALEIRSAGHSLAELEALTGLTPDRTSRNRGDPIPVRGPAPATVRTEAAPSTIFRIESLAEREARLVDHVESIMERIRPEALSRCPSGCTVTLDIAAKFRTFTLTVLLPRECVAQAAALGAELSVSAYPTEDE